jgi:hypothetical protein
MSNVAKQKMQAAEFELMYLLGRAAELQGSATDAVTHDQRVFDLDASGWLSELERAAR